MAETTEPPSDAGTSQADAMALAAEAEAAEAEALAAAARARARAARLKREALAMAPAEDENVPEEYADWEDAEDYDDYDDYEAADQEAARSASWRRRLRVRLPRLSTIAMAAAVVIICGFTGLSGYIVWQHHEATERQQRAAAFAAGAKQGVINMTSLDFNKAKEDVARVIDSSTANSGMTSSSGSRFHQGCRTVQSGHRRHGERDSRRIHERAFRRGARRGDFTGHQFRWGERRTTCVAAQSDRDRRGGTVQDVES